MCSSDLLWLAMGLALISGYQYLRSFWTQAAALQSAQTGAAREAAASSPATARPTPSAPLDNRRAS